jgi:Ras-related protein Rab-1A
MTSSVPDFLFKILLMGDSGVGKSCLMLRHFDDAFTDVYVSTIGFGFEFKVRTVVLSNKAVKLQVWDTSAPMLHRMPSSYRGAHGILVVFDTTDLESFMSVKQRWLPEIERYAHSEVNLTLVGTKLDLSSSRVVPTEEAQLFADQMGIAYWETSSKLGVNVDAAFMDLTRQITRRDFKPVTLLPAPTVFSALCRLCERHCRATATMTTSTGAGAPTSRLCAKLQSRAASPTRIDCWRKTRAPTLQRRPISTVRFAWPPRTVTRLWWTDSCETSASTRRRRAMAHCVAPLSTATWRR